MLETLLFRPVTVQLDARDRRQGDVLDLGLRIGDHHRGLELDIGDQRIRQLEVGLDGSARSQQGGTGEQGEHAVADAGWWRHGEEGRARGHHGFPLALGGASPPSSS